MLIIRVSEWQHDTALCFSEFSTEHKTWQSATGCIQLVQKFQTWWSASTSPLWSKIFSTVYGMVALSDFEQHKTWWSEFPTHKLCPPTHTHTPFSRPPPPFFFLSFFFSFCFVCKWSYLMTSDIFRPSVRPCRCYACCSESGLWKLCSYSVYLF